MTYIDEIIKKKKKIPGPSSYKPNYPKSKCTLFVSRAYAGNAFIDDATVRGRETPGLQNVKYVIILIFYFYRTRLRRAVSSMIKN